MNKKYIWLAKNCPNANHNYYELEDRRQYIYCEKYKGKCKPTDECIKLLLYLLLFVFFVYYGDVKIK